MRAALVPETALLVPGAAGSASVLDDARGAALEAVARLRSARPDRLVVVAPAGRVGPRGWSGARLRPTLAAAAVDDDRLGWVVPARAGDVVVDDVGVAVALHLWARTGGAGPHEPRVEAVTVAASQPAEELRHRGATLVGGTDRVALLVVGSLSARRGPSAPLAEDPRAAGYDAAALAGLVAIPGPAPLPETAWREPGAPPPAPAPGRPAPPVGAGLAAELAASVWAPSEVLRGAVGDRPARVSVGPWSGAPFGATYAVLAWDVA